MVVWLACGLHVACMWLACARKWFAYGLCGCWKLSCTQLDCNPKRYTILSPPPSPQKENCVCADTPHLVCACAQVCGQPYGGGGRAALLCWVSPCQQQGSQAGHIVSGVVVCWGWGGCVVGEGVCMGVLGMVVVVVEGRGS